jgi:hypothetical protein
MAEKITDEKHGKISNILPEIRTVWIKDEIGVTYELNWRQKPEVVDDLMKKQKIGYRVKITLVKDMNEEKPKFWITNCQFDEDYKKRKSAYAQSPEEQKLVLLQSCMRSGAMVFDGILKVYTPKPIGNDNDVEKLFNAMMDKIVARAVKDAATLQAEAKKP